MAKQNSMSNSKVPMRAEQRATASARADAEFLRERKRLEAVNLEKTMRLRALRLAKEAQEAENASLAEQQAPKRKKK